MEVKNFRHKNADLALTSACLWSTMATKTQKRGARPKPHDLEAPARHENMEWLRASPVETEKSEGASGRGSLALCLEVY